MWRKLNGETVDPEEMSDTQKQGLGDYLSSTFGGTVEKQPNG